MTGVLKGLGFTEEDFNKKVSSLSGGQKTRISLGRLLLTKPDIILLDEPTSNLDSLNETVILKAQKSDRICSHKEELFRLLSESVIISTFG